MDIQSQLLLVGVFSSGDFTNVCFKFYFVKMHPDTIMRVVQCGGACCWETLIPDTVEYHSPA